jgi:hypothetical protein
MTAAVLERNNLTQAENARLDAQMAKLAAAVAAADTQAFLTAYRQVDWHNRPVQDYLAVTRMALAAGAYLRAREVSAQGAALYPEEAEIVKLAHILSPPKVIRTDLPAEPALAANHEWLRLHRQEYLGRWVALSQGHLLGVDDSFSALAAQITPCRDILFTKVL